MVMDRGSKSDTIQKDMGYPVGYFKVFEYLIYKLRNFYFFTKNILV